MRSTESALSLKDSGGSTLVGGGGGTAAKSVMYLELFSDLVMGVLVNSWEK